MTTNTITLAITGASGMPYALRLLQCLLEAKKKVYLVVSQAAQVVLAMETELKLPGKIDDFEKFLKDRYQVKDDQLQLFGQNQWSAPIASGTNAADAMVVCPCTSGCASAIAQGSSNNLLERAADVAIKENKKLILVTRETPLSVIHLENLLKLARIGVTILPASPGFYHNPTSIDDLVDFVVARILDHLGIGQSLMPKWGG
ncbi:MAG: UbiX family flavin prenyltransferase [Proteobacteria bacterium]|nr:UbiX family flavin prenyltransferase [Pseudomonadota bacterium]